ncbi:MAG: DsbA family protein [Rhodobacteraceae bacterium]|nr:DsbA family protein [Paracoccaceae bacterium]
MNYTRRTAMKTIAAGAATLLAFPQTVFAQDDASKVIEMTLGAEDAPITMIEYASFTCPHCANFHTDVMGDLKADYIDTGKVKFIYREVYFDRFGLWAGLLARCGGEAKYFGFIDLLYSRQREWMAGGAEPATIIANMKKLGKIAGLGDETMDACLQDQEKAQAMVAEFQKNATADEINATPTFMIDGEQYSNMAYSELKELLDSKLGS